MNSSIRKLALLIAIVAFQPGYAHHAALPDGMSSAQATWLWGHHSIPGDITLSGTPYWYVYPHTDVKQISNPVWSEVAETHIKPGAKAPAVLVLHGCSGLPRGTTEYRRFFIGSGYAVFEPDSYARPGKRCGEGFYDLSFPQRVEELKQALIEIRKLDWVDQNRLFLMGISEGGRVTAEWSENGFAGHIIIAAPCSAEGQIPAAPKNVPVLAAVGENDDWAIKARCLTNTHAPGSNSVVIKDAGHGIPEHPEVGKAVAGFLQAVGSQ
jgi:dienelactone hydrolase